MAIDGCLKLTLTGISGMKRSLSLTCLVALIASAAHAGVIPDGRYLLGSHPDGGANPPPYGLRLDGLDGNVNSIFTFDFDYVDGTTGQTAMMQLSLDQAAGEIRIWGSAYGGREAGSVYDNVANGAVGWWDIDFTYNMNVTSFGTGDGYNLDDAYVSAPAASNSGSISRAFASTTMNQSYALTDYETNGGLSFRFGDDSRAPGHRGYDGISGWGWLNHDGVPGQHIAASDWLFTAELVPVPGALVLGMVGFGFVGVMRRRFAA